ncbi:hypothetical protein BKA60DRAFT_588677 [Fusarium oxysporum]|nr:hypothetical protein BKA60DRAFT_588677 [Fusarium oxysporum]
MAVTDSLVQRRQLQPSCWAADGSSKYPAIVGGRYCNLSQILCTFGKSSATCPFWTLIVFVEAIQKSTIYSRDAPVRFLRLPSSLSFFSFFPFLPEIGHFVRPPWNDKPVACLVSGKSLLLLVWLLRLKNNNFGGLVRSLLARLDVRMLQQHVTVVDKIGLWRFEIYN